MRLRSARRLDLLLAAAFVAGPGAGAALAAPSFQGLGDLAELGLDLTGWTLNRATDISADGTLIVGWGTNPNGDPESWIAVIPEPSTGWLLAAGLAGLLSLRRARRS